MNLTSARRYHGQQQRLAALAVRTARKRPRDAARTVLTHQLAATALAVEAAGSILGEQGIDPAGESLNPTAFTSGDTTGAMLEASTDEHHFYTLVGTLVSDAGRSAMGAFITTRRANIGHVRYLSPPSCDRCTILAGRWYRWSDGFLRHPGCDCVMVPASAVASPDLVGDPMEAFENGQIGGYRTLPDGTRRFEAGLNKAQIEAIRDGADISQVVNSRRGMSQTTTIKGVRFNFTTEGTTRRGIYGRTGPAARSMERVPGERYLRATKSRLTPDTIYRVASDREHAIRLLKSNGYILP